MKIEIVGANSQVGTELCFRLNASDVKAVPITRNELGAATFSYHGFEYRVGDLADQTDAKALLGDLDVVVIAAFARYVSRGDLQSKEVRRTNESLVKNAVKHASEGACVIYFSSIAAFGSDVRDTNWWWYTREKRHLETVFQKTNVAATDKYAFRLGHVFGGKPRGNRATHYEFGREERNTCTCRSRPPIKYCPHYNNCGRDFDYPPTSSGLRYVHHS